MAILDEIKKYFPRQILHEGGVSTFGDVPAILWKTESEPRPPAQTGFAASTSEWNRVGWNRCAHPQTGVQIGRDAGRSRSLKRSNVQVGLILMLGIGGKEYEKRNT